MSLGFEEFDDFHYEQDGQDGDDEEKVKQEPEERRVSEEPAVSKEPAVLKELAVSEEKEVVPDEPKVELAPWKFDPKDFEPDNISTIDVDADWDTDLDTGKRAEEKKTKEQTILSYAETLHKGLKFLWFPMVCLGRLPFRLLLKNNRAIIYVRKTSLAYIACCATCLITWILFIWISLGMVSLSLIAILTNADFTTTDKVGAYMSQRYWSDTFIFWTTLLQACISTTHILSEANTLATFIKDWYRVLDTSKIEVSRTLKQYIILNEVILAIFIIAMIVMFALPEQFPLFQGTTWVIVIALGEPIIWFRHVEDNKTHFADGTFYFQRYAFIGLFVYIVAIVFSWMYVIQFMVFGRCFRKGLKCINNRLAMVLHVDDVQRIGPNAQRLSYEFIHKDYLGIATTGSHIGRIYSWTMCNFYLWAILVLVVELGEIFKFAKMDYRKTTPDEAKRGDFFAEQGFERDLPPDKVVINQLLHFIVTAVCIFYISFEGAAAHTEGKIGYELARYRGLVDCSTQMERNFIRSIWLIFSEKCPVHISPGRFFGVTHSTVMVVFVTSFTYFIFWVQSQGQLESVAGGGT